MKKGTKIGLGIGTALLGMFLLTGCTNSFCSTVDKAHILYAIDHGVCEYYDSEEAAIANEKRKDDNITTEGVVGQLEGTNVWYNANLDHCGYLKKINTNAANSNFSTPTLTYYIAFDEVLLKHAVQQYANDTQGDFDTIKSQLTADQIGSVQDPSSWRSAVPPPRPARRP